MGEQPPRRRRRYTAEEWAEVWPSARTLRSAPTPLRMSGNPLKAATLRNSYLTRPGFERRAVSA